MAETDVYVRFKSWCP